jgi:hypothetical protein
MQFTPSIKMKRMKRMKWMGEKASSDMLEVDGRESIE